LATPHRVAGRLILCEHAPTLGDRRRQAEDCLSASPAQGLPVAVSAGGYRQGVDTAVERGVRYGVCYIIGIAANNDRARRLNGYGVHCID